MATVFTFDRLRFTSEISRGRNIIFLDSNVIGLTPVRFSALVALTCSLFIRPRGYTAVADLGDDPNAVYKTIERLRGDINGAMGSGVGTALIVTLGRGVYKLAVDPNTIDIDHDLQSLVPHTIAEQEIRVLYQHARVCQGNVIPLSGWKVNHALARSGNAEATQTMHDVPDQFPSLNES